MRTLLIIVAALLFCTVACGQETQSVLVNPPESQSQVQSMPPVVQIPQVTYVLRKGFFGSWRLEPVYPVQFIVVRPAPRPVVIWQPWIVWR